MQLLRKLFNRDYAVLHLATFTWLIGITYSYSLALFVGMFVLFWYGEYYKRFIEKILSNEYPYNLLAIFGVVVFGICIIISRMTANQLISMTTGFSPNLFANSSIILTAVLMLIICSWCFCLYGLLAWVSKGFAVDVSIKMGASAFMVGYPLALLTYDITISKSGGLIKFSENVIMISDFHPNASLEGTHFLPPPQKKYSIKTCLGLPNNYWISPLPSGGYIVAVPRKDYEPESSIMSIRDRPTGSIYKMIERKDCPENGRYSEG